LLNGFFNSYRKCLSSDDVAELYDGRYRELLAAHPAAYTIKDTYKIHIFNEPAFRYLRENGKRGARLLDIGCGAGDFCFASAAEFGMSTIGVDSDAEILERNSSRLVPGCQFLKEDSLHTIETNSLDYITLNDVSEHLSDSELSRLM